MGEYGTPDVWPACDGCTVMMVGIGGEAGQQVATMPRQQKKQQVQMARSTMRNAIPAQIASDVESIGIRKLGG